MSTATRLGHADLAPLAALALLRGVVRRWKQRRDEKKAGAAQSLSTPPAAEAALNDAPSGSCAATVSDVVLPPTPQDAASVAAVDATAGLRVTAGQRRAAAKAARAAAQAAELELARQSFHNPYVLPFFRPSDDQVRFFSKWLKFTDLLNSSKVVFKC